MGGIYLRIVESSPAEISHRYRSAPSPETLSPLITPAVLSLFHSLKDQFANNKVKIFPAGKVLKRHRVGGRVRIVCRECWCCSWHKVGWYPRKKHHGAAFLAPSRGRYRSEEGVGLITSEITSRTDVDRTLCCVRSRKSRNRGKSPS